MKILWVEEPLLPQVAQLTGEKPSFAGGWLVSVCDDLLSMPENELIVCYRSVRGFHRCSGGRLTGWSFVQDPLKYSKELEQRFYALLQEEQPDVIHIWGTEFPSSLAMLNAAERLNMLDRTVVSIQGLTSIYALHYTAGLPRRVVNGFTLRDFLRRDNIRQQQKKYAKRGEFEVAALKKARHVIGRTRWDSACLNQINPQAEYHRCNETLRPEFYEGCWSPETCERNTIFVSQGNYPIKGFHMALKALAMLRRDYPDIKLITTGEDPRVKGWRAKLRRSSYARYLAKLIRDLGLEDRVEFLGSLSAEQMRDQYLRAHVALNPSSIENSSNAIGEAQKLGTPVVASFVGGTPDLMDGMSDGLLYPFDEPCMLAYDIDQILGSDEYALRLCEYGREAAWHRHHRVINRRELWSIYQLLSDSPEQKE